MHGEYNNGGEPHRPPTTNTPITTTTTTKFTTGEDHGVMNDDVIKIRIKIPEFAILKCVEFNRFDTVATAKQQCLSLVSKDLKYSYNYGLFMPSQNNRAGKFLDDARPISDYPFSEEIGLLELKYKRRVYKTLRLDEKHLKSVHSRSNLSRFVNHIASGNVGRVATMCERGLDPNFYCNDAGETPLILASGQRNCSEMIMTLLNGGALLDFRNHQGATAVHQAVQKNNYDALKILLELGASPNYMDNRGLSPLYYSVLYKCDARLTMALLHEHASIGIRDDKGWAEVHQAARQSLTQHLEQLLLYGADPDVHNASGNTALHVCAVNNEEACARLLLHRGASTHALNYANQSAYQVAIIAGNLALADLIRQHRPEHVVKFKEKPSYNSRRRSQRVNSIISSHMSLTRSQSLLSSSTAPSSTTTLSGVNGRTLLPPSSPTLSDRSTALFSHGSQLMLSSSSAASSVSDTSSAGGIPAGGGVGERAARMGMGSLTEGSMTLTPQILSLSLSGSVGADQLDVVSDSSGVGSGSGSGDSVAPEPQSMEPQAPVGSCSVAVCMLPYNGSLPGHLQLASGDIVEVLASTDDGLLEGRRTCDPVSVTGLFPSNCVEYVQMRRRCHNQIPPPPSASPLLSSLPPSASPLLSSLPPSTSPPQTPPVADLCVANTVRTVTLSRDRRGFGFVLRGAKAGSPLLQLSTTAQCPALQYLDQVDAGDAAHRAGLRKCDFVLAVNGVDVSRQSHETVVEMIRRSGDRVTLTVASPPPLTANTTTSKSKAKNSSRRGSTTSLATIKGYASLPRRLTSVSLGGACVDGWPSRSVSRSSGVASNAAGAPPPPPPPRDPRTSLSVGRARARSMADALMLTHTDSAIYSNGCVAGSGGGRVACVRTHTLAARPTQRELEEMFARQGDVPAFPPSAAQGGPRVYASVAEMKRKRGKKGRSGSLGTEELGDAYTLDGHQFIPRAANTFGSTPDLLRQLTSAATAATAATAGQLTGRPMYRSQEHLHSAGTPGEGRSRYSIVAGTLRVESSFRPNDTAKLYAVPSTVLRLKEQSSPPSSPPSSSSSSQRSQQQSVDAGSDLLLPPPPARMLAEAGSASALTELDQHLRQFNQRRAATGGVKVGHQAAPQSPPDHSHPPYVTRISTECLDSTTTNNNNNNGSNSSQQQQQQNQVPSCVTVAVTGSIAEPLPPPPIQFRDCQPS